MGLLLLIRRCYSGLLKDYCQFIGNSDQTLAWILVKCIFVWICRVSQCYYHFLNTKCDCSKDWATLEKPLIIWYIIGNMSPYEVNSTHSVSNSGVFSQSSWPPSLHGNTECCHAAEGKGPQLEPTTHWTLSKGSSMLLYTGKNVCSFHLSH